MLTAERYVDHVIIVIRFNKNAPKRKGDFTLRLHYGKTFF